MGKIYAMLAAVFLLALGAGLGSGMLVSRAGTRSGSTAAGGVASPLAQELNLTNEQSARMREIWEGVRDIADDCYQSAQSLQKDREKALLGLLSNEQKAKYEQITQGYAEKFAALNAKRESAFARAVERTNEILSPEQRAKYMQMIAGRMGRLPTTGAHGLTLPAEVVPGTQPASH